MAIRIRDNNNIPRVMRQLNELEGKKISVGIRDVGEMGMIAAVHEFGARIPVTDKMRGYLASIGYPLKASTTEIVIPERSFIRAGFDSVENEFVRHAKDILKQALKLSIPADRVLEMLGFELKGKMQEYLTDLDDPPLSDMTVELTGRSNPLINTTSLRKAIDYEVMG